MFRTSSVAGCAAGALNCLWMCGWLKMFDENKNKSKIIMGFWSRKWEKHPTTRHSVQSRNEILRVIIVTPAPPHSHRIPTDVLLKAIKQEGSTYGYFVHVTVYFFVSFLCLVFLCILFFNVSVSITFSSCFVSWMLRRPVYLVFVSAFLCDGLPRAFLSLRVLSAMSFDVL